MRKIPTLFVRDMTTRRITPEINPDVDWHEGRGWFATVKHDGTCCMVRAGTLYKRYEVGTGKTPPPCFEAATEVDPVTGKQQGWVPVGDGPADRWHREAFGTDVHWPDGTYELLGPKVQGNPHLVACHILVPHGTEVLHDAPRDFEGLQAYLTDHAIEGIVFWRDPTDKDCDKCKVKARDFGLPWPPKPAVVPHA